MGICKSEKGWGGVGVDWRPVYHVITRVSFISTAQSHVHDTLTEITHIYMISTHYFIKKTLF